MGSFRRAGHSETLSQKWIISIYTIIPNLRVVDKYIIVLHELNMAESILKDLRKYMHANTCVDTREGMMEYKSRMGITGKVGQDFFWGVL